MDRRQDFRSQQASPRSTSQQSTLIDGALLLSSVDVRQVESITHSGCISVAIPIASLDIPIGRNFLKASKFESIRMIFGRQMQTRGNRSVMMAQLNSLQARVLVSLSSLSVSESHIWNLLILKWVEMRPNRQISIMIPRAKPLKPLVAIVYVTLSRLN